MRASGCKVTERILHICINWVIFSNFPKFLSWITEGPTKMQQEYFGRERLLHVVVPAVLCSYKIVYVLHICINYANLGLFFKFSQILVMNNWGANKNAAGIFRPRKAASCCGSCCSMFVQNCVQFRGVIFCRTSSKHVHEHGLAIIGVSVCLWYRLKLITVFSPSYNPGTPFLWNQISYWSQGNTPSVGFNETVVGKCRFSTNKSLCIYLTFFNLPRPTAATATTTATA